MNTTVASRSIDFLRLPLAFSIVLLHSVQSNLPEGATLYYANDLHNAIKILFSEIICRASVPLFFFVSGYLFFNHIKELGWNTYQEKVKKRCRTLLLPYVIWNVLCLLTLYVLHLIANGITCSLKDFFVEKGSWNIFFYGRRGYPIDYPLWFVRDLIYMVILSPVIYYIVRRKGLLCFICVLYLITPAIGLSDTIPTTAICFFSLGAYFNIMDKDFICSERCFRNLVFLGIPLIVVCEVSYGDVNIPMVYPIAIRLFTLVGGGFIFM